MKTDEELVNDFRSGKPDAFETLVERYTPRLYQFLGGQPESMDLVQETFKKAYRNLSSFNIKRSFKSWIFSIATNCRIDAYRKSGSRFPLIFSPETVESEIDPFDCPATSLKKAEKQDQVQKAIEQLSEKQQQVLILSYYHNLSYQQIAQRLNTSVSTVKTHMARAIRNLCSLLPDNEGLL